MKKISFIPLFLLLAVGVMGCKSSRQSGKPIIAVSLPPQKFFVASIAGDLVDVVVMVPAGSSTEEYDPSPRNIMDLESADLYFYIGTLPYEAQWIDAINQSKNPARMVNLSEALPHDVTCTHEHSGHEYVHPMGDPHYWTSILAGELIADVVYQTLCDEFPEHKATFEQNYTTLKEQLNTLDIRANKVFQSNGAQKSFVIYHPSLSLFSKEWHLNQLVIEQDGKQPTPIRLKELLEEAKAQKASVVILQQEYDTKTAESISKELGLPTHVINPLEENWLQQMNTLIDAFDPEAK